MGEVPVQKVLTTFEFQRERAREAFFAFVEEFARESDRAAVILGVAKLDTQLYTLLAKVLVPSGGSSDELLDGDGPLSTFSAKINIALRLGLIDASLTRALHLCRRIRNVFAHEIANSTLNAHRDRIRELVNLCHGIGDGFESFRRAFFGEASGPATDFRTVLGLVAVRLDRAINDCIPLSAERACALVPPERRPATAAAVSAGPKEMPSATERLDRGPETS